MSELTVSAGFAKALRQLAIAKGASAELLDERSHLSSVDLSNPDNRITMTSYMALMKAAKQLCGDPALALKFSELTDFGQISIAGLICQSSNTMGDALDQLNRYARLVIEIDGATAGDRFAVVRQADETWLEDMWKIPPGCVELSESALSRFVCEHRRSFGDRPFAKAVHFKHAEPVYGAEYRRIFDVPVVFDSDRNAILIHECWLDMEIPPANKYVFALLCERADALIERLENSKTLAGKVEAALLSTLHRGEAQRSLVAKQLGTTEQTLYRKLKAEGVNFEQLLDRLCHRMAVDFLSSGNVSVGEAAYLVGFADPSSFSRAFKRWTGMRPKQAMSKKILPYP